jgi:hypothetical protein
MYENIRHTNVFYILYQCYPNFFELYPGGATIVVLLQSSQFGRVDALRYWDLLVNMGLCFERKIL